MVQTLTAKQIIQEYKEGISGDDQERIRELISKDSELVSLLAKMYGDIILCTFNNISTAMPPEAVKDTFLYFKSQKDLIELLLNLDPE